LSAFFAAGTCLGLPAFNTNKTNPREQGMGRGLLLWLLGIPLPIILVIWLLGGLS
jgi:hypothetical protein